LLIGVGWLSFVLSIRWVSDSVLEPRARPVPEQKDPAGGVDRKTASM
jgi:hypothetical protein